MNIPNFKGNREVNNMASVADAVISIDKIDEIYTRHIIDNEPPLLTEFKENLAANCKALVEIGAINFRTTIQFKEICKLLNQYCAKVEEIREELLTKIEEYNIFFRVIGDLDSVLRDYAKQPELTQTEFSKAIIESFANDRKTNIQKMALEIAPTVDTLYKLLKKYSVDGTIEAIYVEQKVDEESSDEDLEAKIAFKAKIAELLNKEPEKIILKDPKGVSLSKKIVFTEEVHLKDRKDQFKHYAPYIILNSHLEKVKATTIHPSFYLYLNEKSELAVLVIHSKTINETIHLSSITGTKKERRLVDGLTVSMIEEVQSFSEKGIEKKQIRLENKSIRLIGSHCTQVNPLSKEQNPLRVVLLSESEGLKQFVRDYSLEENTRMPDSIEGCELLLMSDLPKTGPEKGKMYLEKQGSSLQYIVMTPEGKPVSALLDIAMDELTKESLALYREAILEITSQRGHTRTREKEAIEKAEATDAFIENLSCDADVYIVCVDDKVSQENIDKIKDKMDDRIIIFINENSSEDRTPFYYHDLVIDSIRCAYIRYDEDPMIAQFKRLLSSRAKENARKGIGDRAISSELIKMYTILNQGPKKVRQYYKMTPCLATPLQDGDLNKAEEGMMYVNDQGEYMIRQGQENHIGKLPYMRQYSAKLNKRPHDPMLKMKILSVALKQKHIRFKQFWYELHNVIASIISQVEQGRDVRSQLKDVAKELVIHYNSHDYGNEEKAVKRKLFQVIDLSMSESVEESLIEYFPEKNTGYLSELSEEFSANMYIILLSVDTPEEYLNKIQSLLEKGFNIIKITVDHSEKPNDYFKKMVDEIYSIYTMPEEIAEITNLKKMLAERAKEILSSEEIKITVFSDLIKAYVAISAYHKESLACFEQYNLDIEEVNIRYKQISLQINRDCFGDRKLLQQRRSSLEKWAVEQKDAAMMTLLDNIRELLPKAQTVQAEEQKAEIRSDVALVLDISSESGPSGSVAEESEIVRELATHNVFVMAPVESDEKDVEKEENVFCFWAIAPPVDNLEKQNGIEECVEPQIIETPTVSMG